MKKSIFIFCLVPFSIIAQINSKFIYCVSVIDLKDSKMQELMKSISPDYGKLVSDIEFDLITNKNESSCFVMNKKTLPDDDGVKMFLAMSNYEGQIIQKADSLFIEKNTDLLLDKYSVKDTINKTWKILDESKNIMGYKCYKAICEKIVINPRGKFKNDIIAWFCPQLPYQFGPMGYGKLPGLIFELQTKFALFGIKKILLQTNEPSCVLDKKRTFINNKEFEEISTKAIENKRVLMKK